MRYMRTARSVIWQELVPDEANEPFEDRERRTLLTSGPTYVGIHLPWGLVLLGRMQRTWQVQHGFFFFDFFL